MRQRIGCATCALEGWIEDFYPCYLWKECPEDLLKQGQEADSEDSSDSGSDDNTARTAKARTRKEPLLKDGNGYYVGSAEAVHKHLDVENYIQAFPLIPKDCMHRPCSTLGIQSIDGC